MCASLSLGCLDGSLPVGGVGDTPRARVRHGWRRRGVIEARARTPHRDRPIGTCPISVPVALHVALLLGLESSLVLVQPPASAESGGAGGQAARHPTQIASERDRAVCPPDRGMRCRRPAGNPYHRRGPERLPFLLRCLQAGSAIRCTCRARYSRSEIGWAGRAAQWPRDVHDAHSALRYRVNAEMRNIRPSFSS
jgi:hypothetical protein